MRTLRGFGAAFVAGGALLLAAACVAPAGAAPARVPTLVGTGWLERSLGDPALVVLHPGTQRADYDAGHVPGARYLPWALLTPSRDSLATELPDPARLDSLLEAAGVSNHSRIVIAGGPVTMMARLLVTLDHFGLGARASILDGGIDAWRAERRPLSRDTTRATPGDVTLEPAGRVVDAAWVSAHGGAGPRLAVVDARTPEFFQGLASNNNPRMGRLPGAGNVPFTWLTREYGRFRAPGEMRELFERAGVGKGDRVVTYCHLGIQACVAYVAARSLGWDVAMYDGSFEDWSRRRELPVESGPPADR